MEIEENENNLTVMVVDGRLKYYQKKDADKLLNQQQKEIEQLKDEVELQTQIKNTYRELKNECIKENTKLIEQLKELNKFNKNVSGVLESRGRAHLSLDLLSMLDKSNELLTN